jgi:virginiamycin A acetyltransferase
MPDPSELPFKGDTIVGNDVWIGYEALVMPGVTIGNGAIVSSRSLVVRDVPPYTIVGGNPAKPLKQRFSADVVDALQSIAWWEWPIDKITRHLKIIVSGDVDALRACAGDG